jgi:hypothetical protein
MDMKTSAQMQHEFFLLFFLDETFFYKLVN